MEVYFPYFWGAAAAGSCAWPLFFGNQRKLEADTFFSSMPLLEGSNLVAQALSN